MESVVNTHGFRMVRGKYGPKGDEPGMLITRVPLHYLKWMVNEGHEHADYARAELSRRGTVLPEIELSGHAIDRASIRCRKHWHETALNPDEGLHAWLLRVSKAAWDFGIEVADPHSEDGGRNVTKEYAGLKFAFMQGEEFPVLKTVMPR